LEPDDIQRATFPVVRRGYDPAEVEAFLQRVASEYRDALWAAEEASRAAQEGERAALTDPSSAQGFENVGAHVAAILGSAAQAAEEMRAASEQESEAIRDTAIREVNQIREAAVREMEAAQEAKAIAERDATNTRAVIRREAARMQQEGRARAAAIEAEAREAAARIEQTVRGNVEAIVASARSQYERLRAAQQRAHDRLASIEALIQEARKEALPDPGGDPFERVGPSTEPLEVALDDPPHPLSDEAGNGGRSRGGSTAASVVMDQAVSD
jgi:DivIVA domain-containing protein